MKNKISLILLSFVLLSALFTTVIAAEVPQDNFSLIYNESPAISSEEDNFDEERLVVDKAELLSVSQEQQLRDKLINIRQEYKIEAAILIIDDLENKSAKEFADDFYDYNGYGYGAGCDGVILLYKDGEPGNRELYLSTYGVCIKQFTDFDVENILNEFQNNLIDYGVFEAYSSFIDYCDNNLYRYSQGISDAEYEEELSDDVEKVHPMWIPISLLIGFVVAYIIMRSVAAPLKSVRKKNSAADYVRSGSMNLTVSRDRFLYKNISKTARPKDTDHSSSSGSSSTSTTHTSSSGRTHGGGGSRF